MMSESERDRRYEEGRINRRLMMIEANAWSLYRETMLAERANIRGKPNSTLMRFCIDHAEAMLEEMERFARVKYKAGRI